MSLRRLGASGVRINPPAFVHALRGVWCLAAGWHARRTRLLGATPARVPAVPAPRRARGIRGSVRSLARVLTGTLRALVSRAGTPPQIGLTEDRMFEVALASPEQEPT